MANIYNKLVKTYKIDRNLIIDEDSMKKVVMNYYNYHKLNWVQRYMYLQQNYEGIHEILDREEEDETKPNQKLINNYCKYITDVAIGYFLGIAVTYESDNEDYMQVIQDINESNDESDENSELGKQCSIKGRAYELIYTDENADIKFNLLKAEESFVIYDNAIKPNPLLAVRFYDVSDLVGEAFVDRTILEVYTSELIYKYEVDGLTLKELEPARQHIFNTVPMIEYKNNEEILGDFEVVMSLINAYNDSQSDTSNDFKYFTDAFLVLFGLGGTDSRDIANMKKERVLLLEENGKAEWLIKEINDLATENYKNRLDKDIAKFSLVPNLTDENFANNASGVAMQYKLWGLEQLTSIKERKFRKSLNERYNIINNVLNIMQTKTDKLKATFYRNIPKNIVEIAKMLNDLGSIVSNETKLNQLPFVENSTEEMDRIRNEVSEVAGDNVD